MYVPFYAGKLILITNKYFRATVPIVFTVRHCYSLYDIYTVLFLFLSRLL